MAHTVDCNSQSVWYNHKMDIKNMIKENKDEITLNLKFEKNITCNVFLLSGLAIVLMISSYHVYIGNEMCSDYPL